MPVGRGGTPAGDIGYSEIVPTSAVVFNPTARTVTPATNGFAVPRNCSAVMVVINTTASAAPSTVFVLEGYDPATDTFFPIVTSAAVVANGYIILRAYPGAVAAAGLTVDSVIPRIIRISATHGNANSHTYGVSVHFSQA